MHAAEETRLVAFSMVSRIGSCHFQPSVMKSVRVSESDLEKSRIRDRDIARVVISLERA